MFPVNSVDTHCVVFKTTFEVLQSPERIALNDTLLDLSVTSSAGGRLTEEEKLLAYALGIRSALTRCNPSSTSLCIELGVTMDTLLRQRYPRVTFKPAIVSVTKKLDPNTCSCVGGTVEVKTIRGHGNVRNVLAKI